MLKRRSPADTPEPKRNESGKPARRLALSPTRLLLSRLCGVHADLRAGLERSVISPHEPARKIPDPPGYVTQRRLLAGLSEAQQRWQQETGARLEVLPGPPYFRYSRSTYPYPLGPG